MLSTTTIQRSADVKKSAFLQISTAALFGFLVIFAVGFSPMNVAHNAAHDTRHSLAFPCH